MASPRTRRVLKELKFKDGNNVCFECSCHNPQWVSVTYAVWICLDCSGKHRSVGVHLSFVRSVTMDKWKDTELSKMKVGGNAKATSFFRSQPDYRDDMDLMEKYHSRAAALYRDKIAKESLGEVWSEETSSAKDYVPPILNPPAPRVCAKVDAQQGRFLPFRSKNKGKACDDKKYVGFGSTGMGSHSRRGGGWESPLSSLHQLATCATGKAALLGSKMGGHGGGVGAGTMQGTLRNLSKATVLRGWTSLQSYFGCEPDSG